VVAGGRWRAAHTPYRPLTEACCSPAGSPVPAQRGASLAARAQRDRADPATGAAGYGSRRHREPVGRHRSRSDAAGAGPGATDPRAGAVGIRAHGDESPVVRERRCCALLRALTDRGRCHGSGDLHWADPETLG